MSPITLAVLNDVQLVVDGVAGMLRPFADRVRVVELDCRLPVRAPVDVALYDAFAVSTKNQFLAPQLRNPNIGALAVYTWHLRDDEVHRMLGLGVRAVLAKYLDAEDLVAAIEAVYAGEVVVSPPEPPDGDTAEREERVARFPRHTLTAREAEVIALIAAGLSNADITSQLFISPNTLKSYIRSAYRKMGVERRPQAVAWAVDHGLRPQTRRTDLRLARAAG